jgi:uncharacterized protein (TIGR00369 family)
VTIDANEDGMLSLRTQNHPNCFVCGPSNGYGLGLEVRASAPGVVEGTFECDNQFEGYSGILHGGMTCALLDGAMTNCLFVHGHVAVTAELNVRFRNPIVLGKPVTIKAWIESSGAPLYVLAGEIRQNGDVMATATGKFLDKSMLGWWAKNWP